MPSRWQRNRRCVAATTSTLALAGALAGFPASAASQTPTPTAASAATPAATPNRTAPADRCLDAADDTALLACRKAAHADASRALRQAADKLQQRFGGDAPEHLKLFNAAQQAWRQYSQAECRFRHRESVGSAAYPASLLSCVTELSTQRLQALQTVINRP